MKSFVSPKFLEVLRINQLDTFAKVWDCKVNWFEEPNERRNGWSGVGRIELKQNDGTKMHAFLKKQDKHCRITLLHPIHGVPTFQREFEMMQYLASKGVNTPEVLFFGRSPQENLKTTLMTKELSGFISLEELTEQMFTGKRSTAVQKRSVVEAVAKFTRKLHGANVQHRSFYPKHLFVSMANRHAPEVAVIDLEKSRVSHVSVMRTMMDLSALNRHTKYWSKTQRMAFYLQYLGLKRLSPYSKWLCRMILKRSNRV